MHLARLFTAGRGAGRAWQAALRPAALGLCCHNSCPRRASTTRGSPARSDKTCSLEPGLPRSTGLGPVSSPLFSRARARCRPGPGTGPPARRPRGVHAVQFHPSLERVLGPRLDHACRHTPIRPQPGTGERGQIQWVPPNARAAGASRGESSRRSPARCTHTSGTRRTARSGRVAVACGLGTRQRDDPAFVRPAPPQGAARS